MKKDPKKFQGQVPSNNTYPGERSGLTVEPLVTNLLPSVFRTDINKKVFGAVIEDMFQPSAIENLNFDIGRPTGNIKQLQEFLPRADSRRQFETGLLVSDSTGVRVLTADDVALAQGHSETHLAEPATAVSVLDLPINPDKFVNWSNYYWLEQGVPILYIVGTDPAETTAVINVEQDIIGKQHYTLPVQGNGKPLELKNGMRLVFQKNYPGRNAINGDVTETHIADGSSQLDLDHEMSQQYDKTLIVVWVNGVEKVRLDGIAVDPDYTFTYGSLIWLPGKAPAEGAVVELDLVDYWLSYDGTEISPTPRTDRRWQVEGVGTPGGIRLLPRSMQTTSTVYSSTIQSLWDQTTVPWDRIEWDGDLPGINKKHYVLQSPGATNRNAFSRVNVWIHKDTIQTVCDYLDIKAEEIVNDTKQALRPIIEFDHRLEVFNHGTQYRHWVDAVVDRPVTLEPTVAGRTGLDVFLGHDVLTMMVYVTFGGIDNTESDSGTLFDRIISALATDNQQELDAIVSGFEQPTQIIEALANIRSLLKNLQQGKIANIQRRVLWLVDDVNKNKIITFKTNASNIVSRIEIETAQEHDATVVQPGGGVKSMIEYHWVNNDVDQLVAVPAQTRLTAVQKPLFSIYDRDQITLDQWKEQVGFKPSRLNSTIVEFLEEGNPVDPESGYKLTFLPSQFRELDTESAPAQAMYDILFKHTLQDDTKYLNADGNERSVPGPFSFRRVESLITNLPQSIADGMSSGYRRAWFRLRSWTSNAYDLSTLTANSDGEVSIELPVSAWPRYEWKISFVDNKPQVLHTDNLENNIENILVGAIGQNLYLDTVGIDNIEIWNRDNEALVLTAYPTSQGTITIAIPDSITAGFYELRINALPGIPSMLPDSKLDLLLINAKVDPRSPTVLVDGLPVDYRFQLAIDSVSNVVDGVTIAIASEQGVAEIRHQGEFTSDSDHATALPSLEFNTLQNLNLDKFSPSRVAAGFFRCIRANTISGSGTWTTSTQMPALDGSLMTDVSAVRSVWLEHRSTPSLSQALISRSLSAWRWHRKFLALLERYNNIYDLANENPKITLDRLLEELTVGVNYSQPDSVSGMAFPTGAMNYRKYTASGSQTTFEINTGNQSLYLGMYGPDHVYVYIDGALILRTDYSINSGQVEFVSAPAAGSVIEIYHSGEEFSYSGIPASPAKLGLGGLFQPQIVRETWGDYDRVLIQRHDGSRIMAYQEHWYAESDPRDLVALELEKRIYNGCLNQVGDPKRQRVAQHITTALTPARARAEMQWFETNSLDYRDRSDFVADDPWTWNYDGKSWRAIYSESFGTLQLHTHPWEALGFQEKPEWWDTHYSWTEPGKRLLLEQALWDGLISEPYQPAHYDFRVQRRHSLGYPVNDDAKLMDPVTWGLASPSVDQARQPWDIGSQGPLEDAWLRSPAGAWAKVLDAGTDITTACAFVERGINPFVVPLKNNSPANIGELTLAPSNFVQNRPTIGVGAVLFETNRELSLLGESTLQEMALITPLLQFGVGGFTDTTARFKMYHTRYQTGNFVPEEDFALILNESVPVDLLRYSAVRVDKDGTGFRIYGFDPENRYFTVSTPVKQSASGSTSGSYQRPLATAYGNYIDYTKWSTTPVTVDYGTLIADKQGLFEFFAGLDEYQTSKGLVFDQLAANGAVNNWRQSCIDVFDWIEQNWGTEHFVVASPVSESAGFKISHAEGQLDRLDSDLLRRGKIIFAGGQIAQGSDLLITRDYEPSTDLIQPTSRKQIVFADIKTRKYDHVFYFNSVTRFNDLLMDQVSNQRLSYLSMVARRSRGWTGRYQALGLLPTATGLLPGFDALVSDIYETRRPENSQFNNFLGRVSKSNVVPARASVLRQIIEDNSVEFQYKQGLQNATGTNLAIDALLRNSAIDLPGKLQDIEINEQWLFTDGEFGRLGGRRIWEIELKKSDMTSDRQIIRFLEGRTDRDLRSDNIIDLVGPRDPRWVNRDSQNIEFATVARSSLTREAASEQGWLPSAGVANLDVTDIKARDLQSVVQGPHTNEKIQRLLAIRSFSKFVDYEPEDTVWYEGQLYKSLESVTGGANTAWDPDQWELYTETAVDMPPSIWVSDYNFQRPLGNNLAGQDSVGWTVLQALGPMYVEEACPNALDISLNESRVTFGNPHKLLTGDVFFMTGSGDGNYDRFHLVKDVVDDFNVLIEGRSTSGSPVYNLVAFRLASMKFNSLSALQTGTGDYNLRSGMRAYIEADGNAEGEYQVYKRTATTWVLDEEYSQTGTMVDTHTIESVSILDASNEELLAFVEVFDPYKGLTIDEVAQYVNYRDGVDPAVYNIDDLGIEDVDAAMPWKRDQIGTLWWDTSRVRYLEYEQGSLNYRGQHWGEQFADSEVVVYEWVKSAELPSVDSEPLARRDLSNGVGAVRYSVGEEEDTVTGVISTYYYFWRKGQTDLPADSTRPYTASSIQSVLDDPTVSGTAWMSPIANNALLIANVRQLLATRDSVILRIEQKAMPEQQHVNGLLVSEGITGDVIPEYLFRRLRASVTGRDNYRKSYRLKTWQPNTAYSQGDYLINWSFSTEDRSDSAYGSRDIPVIQILDDGREEVKAVFRPVLDETDPTDSKLHRVFYVRQSGYTSSDNFRQDYLDEHIVVSATSALIKGILESEDYRAVIVSRRRVPDPRLHPLRRYGNAYTPVPQTWYRDIREARRNLVQSANAYLLKVNAVNKDHWDAHLREYQPLFGPYIKNLEPYWRYADYQTSDYQFGSEQLLVSNPAEVTAYEQDTGQEITVFGIVDANGVLQKSFAKDGNDTVLIYQRNGTIQFNDAVWDGSLGDAWDMSRWDRYAWDEDNSEVVESLLTALREDLFVSEDIGYFNLVFFDMVKESLRQVPNANWVSKTTYLNIAQSSSNDLKPVALYFDRRDDLVRQYINEVKPYHSKILDLNQALTTQESISVEIAESVVLDIQYAEYQLTDEDGAVLTDENGVVLLAVDDRQETRILVDGETDCDVCPHPTDVDVDDPFKCPTLE
jgi:hypothetical protein